MPRPFALAAGILWAASLFAAPSLPPPGGRLSAGSWSALVDAYYDEALAFHPTNATWVGIHRYDERLEDFSRKALAAHGARSRHLLRRLEHFPAAGLPEADRHDREVLIHGAKAELLDLEEVRSWERNPDLYSTTLSQSVWVLMSRRFAPAPVRLKALIARERSMPALLRAARANLKAPPEIFTRLALEQLPGIIAFFRSDVPAAFGEVKDARLLAAFSRANGAVVEALGAYQAFLQKELLPVSTGNFALGAAVYARKLLYEEMVDTPLDRLLALGYEDLHRNQAELARIAALIDPKATVEEVMDRAGRNHPAPEGLLQAFRDQLQAAQAFILKRGLLTLPTLTMPSVVESPPFMRATTTASMDTSGPYEKAPEAYFYATLPGADWSPERSESYLSGLNRGTITSTALHEAMPGHYIQFLYLKGASSRVRKLTQCGTSVEGWAHYVEQMMLDEGFGEGDPWIRLGQLQDALLRNARFVVGISLHTGRMTYEEARAFFVKEGHQSGAMADLEARRGTVDPMYLVYTLGKLQILELREAFRRKLGAAYSPRAFHDALLAHGGLPLRIVREELLGEGAPAL